MKIIDIPKDCTQEEFILCAKVALQASARSGGAAIIVLNDDSIGCRKEERKDRYAYRFFSDNISLDMIIHGQQVNLIAIENINNIAEESRKYIPVPILDRDGIVLIKEMD